MADEGGKKPGKGPRLVTKMKRTAKQKKSEAKSDKEVTDYIAGKKPDHFFGVVTKVEGGRRFTVRSSGVPPFKAYLPPAHKLPKRVGKSGGAATAVAVGKGVILNSQDEGARIVGVASGWDTKELAAKERVNISNLGLLALGDEENNGITFETPEEVRKEREEAAAAAEEAAAAAASKGSKGSKGSKTKKAGKKGKGRKGPNLIKGTRRGGLNMYHDLNEEGMPKGRFALQEVKMTRPKKVENAKFGWLVRERRGEEP